MGSLRQIVTATLGLLACCGYPPARHAAPERPLPVQPRTREEVIAYLREKLALVRNAARDEHVDTERTVDVKVLVGMERHAFERELGAPNSCHDPDSSPCSVAGSWYYYFHHLPPAWLGGGSVLFVRFDDSGMSNHVQWGVFK